MRRVAIFGAGKGGSLLIPVIHNTGVSEVVIVVDKNENAPGLKTAIQHDIETAISDSCDSILEHDIDVIINTTGDESCNDDISAAIKHKELKNKKKPELMDGISAKLVWELIEQKQILYDIFELDTKILVYDEVRDAAKLIVEKALEITETKKGNLLYFDEVSHELHSIYSKGYSHRFNNNDWKTTDKGIIPKIIREKKIVIVSNVQENEEYISEVTQVEGIQSFIAVPIEATNKLVGILILNDTKPRKYSEVEKNNLKLLITHSAYILNKDMLLTQLKKKKEHLEAIIKVSDVTSKSLNMREISEKGLEKVLEVLNYDLGVVRIFNGDSLELIASRNISADYSAKHKIININDMIKYNSKLKDGKVVCVGNTEKMIKEGKVSTDYIKHEGAKSFVIVPLMSAENIVGVMNLGNRSVTTFENKDKEILTSIGNVIGVAIENAKFHESLEQKFNRIEILKGLRDTAGDLIIITDMEKKIQEFNEPAEYLLGYKKQEVMGNCICTFFETKDDESEISKLLQQNNSVHNFHTIFKKSNSEIIEVSLSQSYMENSARKNIGIVNIVRDVSESNRINRQITQADKLASIGVLAAGVAHELNNPLAAIKLNLQLLQKSIKNPEDCKNINAILEDITIMREIINHIGEFSRESEIKRVPNDINEIIKDSFTMLNQQLKDKDIEVVVKSEPNIPKILCNRLKLQQVFMNLISNAKDAINANGKGKERRITIITINKGNEVVITVLDTGIGLSDNERQRIFDPFFSMKGIGKGTGLGLSIGYGIIKEHKGSIEVNSELGKGTTFIIKLPTQ